MLNRKESRRYRYRCWQVGKWVVESGSSLWLLPFFSDVWSKVISWVLALLSKYIETPITFSSFQLLPSWSKLSTHTQSFANGSRSWSPCFCTCPSTDVILTHKSMMWLFCSNPQTAFYLTQAKVKIVVSSLPTFCNLTSYYYPPHTLRTFPTNLLVPWTHQSCSFLRSSGYGLSTVWYVSVWLPWPHSNYNSYSLHSLSPPRRSIFLMALINI